MSVRLNKVIKECNVGLQTVVDFMKKKGFTEIEANPAQKISDEQYQMLLDEFNSDQA